MQLEGLVASVAHIQTENLLQELGYELVHLDLRPRDMFVDLGQSRECLILLSTFLGRLLGDLLGLTLLVEGVEFVQIELGHGSKTGPL